MTERVQVAWEREVTFAGAATATVGALLIANSPTIRREVEDNGRMILSTHYQPTNWDVEDDEILDGWTETTGTCQRCWTLRSASGACNCTEGRK